MYLRKAGVLHVLDAANHLSAVTDAGTGLPVALETDHLVSIRLLRVQPASLAVSLFAEVGPSYNGGAVWSPAFGKALVIDNSSNVLRAYAPGDSSLGAVIPCDVLLPSGASSGWGTQSLTDVDVLGPVSAGSASQWGQETAGTGGYVPLLGAGSCPRIGRPLPLTLGTTLGGAQGLLIAGLNAGAVGSTAARCTCCRRSSSRRRSAGRRDLERARDRARLSARTKAAPRAKSARGLPFARGEAGAPAGL